MQSAVKRAVAITVHGSPSTLYCLDKHKAAGPDVIHTTTLVSSANVNVYLLVGAFRMQLELGKIPET